jgi:hypothetical protein
MKAPANRGWRTTAYSSAMRRSSPRSSARSKQDGEGVEGDLGVGVVLAAGVPRLAAGEQRRVGGLEHAPKRQVDVQIETEARVERVDVVEDPLAVGTLAGVVVRGEQVEVGETQPRARVGVGGGVDLGERLGRERGLLGALRLARGEGLAVDLRDGGVQSLEARVPADAILMHGEQLGALAGPCDLRGPTGGREGGEVEHQRVAAGETDDRPEVAAVVLDVAVGERAVVGAPVAGVDLVAQGDGLRRPLAEVEAVGAALVTPRAARLTDERLTVGTEPLGAQLEDIAGVEALVGAEVAPDVDRAIDEEGAHELGVIDGGDDEGVDAGRELAVEAAVGGERSLRGRLVEAVAVDAELGRAQRGAVMGAQAPTDRRARGHRVGRLLRRGHGGRRRGGRRLGRRAARGEHKDAADEATTHGSHGTTRREVTARPEVYRKLAPSVRRLTGAPSRGTLGHPRLTRRAAAPRPTRRS